ncbi:hypothetical protein Tco_1521925, partial [Tanacetum coccineum]
MYRVVTTQESQTNKTKSVLSSTGVNATSSVRRPLSRDSHVKNIVLDVSKNAAKKEVFLLQGPVACRCVSFLKVDLHPRLPDPGFTMDHLLSDAIEMSIYDFMTLLSWGDAKWYERISKKRTKNEAQNDKTGHGMEKRGKDT